MAKKYLLGLDLGTNSVGWCVTDENSEIVRKGGKSLWGVRLFEEAQPAADRRMNRANRRRTLRRAQRIDLLQELFYDEIAKTDPSFFMRLNQSALRLKDRSSEVAGTPYLFVDKGVASAKYPGAGEMKTMFHLRKHLMESKAKADIRVLYLAIAHIVKYRGNFLYQGRDFRIGDNETLRESILEINHALAELEYPTLPTSDDVIAKLANVGKETRGISQTKEKLAELFGITDKYVKGIVASLIAGSEIATKKIFDADEDLDPKSICVKSESFDEAFSALAEQFSGSPQLELIAAAKRISDVILLGKLLGSQTSISKAMVARFDEHKKDLKALKKHIKKVCPEKYDSVFRDYSPTLNNYVRYVGSNNTGAGKIRCAHCSREDFYKFLKGILGIEKTKKAEDIKDPFLHDIYEKMADGSYLPRQNSSDNGVFPYQLHLMELEAILKNQSEFYPFLNEKDEDGWTVAEKIKKLVTFRIPYYVGPLLAPKEGEERGKNSWIVRGPEKIYPWNFDRVVDKGKTAENFIRRMLNRCTYLRDCYCLPAKSIIYQRFVTYDFLNKLRINGALLNAEDKQRLIEELFLKHKSVTKKRLVDYFKARYGQDVAVTTAKDKELDEINCSLSSEIEMKAILKKDYDLDKAESIIQDITIFEEESILVERLKSVHGIKDPAMIKSLKNLPYSGWGRLSKELLSLTTSYVDIDTGEVKQMSLLDIMATTNLNFMEVLNDQRFNFLKQIEEHNDGAGIGADGIKGYINESYASPGMKRALIQTFAIIDDLKKILGRPIDEYYIECTRTNKEKGGVKTQSRKDKILAYYKEAKKVTAGIIRQEIESLEDKANKLDTGSFRSDRVWLYFLQLGKCAYTLQPIELDDLFNDNLYDIDHIVPQSKIKDDSLSNRVLVCSWANREKSDRYPLHGLSFINEETRKFWAMLKARGLMDEKKYNALVRRDDISDEELELFISRQLVFTNQSVKALADTIKQFEKTASGEAPLVVYSKAENISDFRKQHDILKSRDANNFHHAHDAYLNICIGRLLSTYYNYGRYPDFVRRLRENKQSVVPSRIWSDNKEGNRPCRYDADGLVWDYQKSIGKIKENIYQRFDVMVTTRSFIRNGLFAKVSIHPASDNKDGNLIPLKKGEDALGKAYMDTASYGGYSDQVYGFYALIKKLGKKEAILLEGVPNLFAKPDDVEGIHAYFAKKYGPNGFEILLPCIRAKTLFRKGKTKLIITGVTSGGFAAANQSEPYFSKLMVATIRKVGKYIDALKKEKLALFKFSKDGATENPEAADRASSFMPIKPDGSIIVSPAKAERNTEIAISPDELSNLYDEISKKLNSPIYEHLSGCRLIGSFLSQPEPKAKFQGLNIHGKLFVVAELIKAVGTDRSLSNLVLIGGSANAGSNALSGSSVHSFDIISQSPTGYYEKVIWKGDR